MLEKRCMLVEYVKDIYYARFLNPSYHKNRETLKLTDRQNDGRTEIRTPISHPAISRCDKNQYKTVISKLPKCKQNKPNGTQ